MLEQMRYLTSTFFLHCRCISNQQKYTAGFFTSSSQFRLPTTCVATAGNSPPDRGLLDVSLLTKRHLLKLAVGYQITNFVQLQLS